jgi:hypothetical protein
MHGVTHTAAELVAIRPLPQLNAGNGQGRVAKGEDRPNQQHTSFRNLLETQGFT